MSILMQEGMVLTDDMITVYLIELEARRKREQHPLWRLICWLYRQP